MKPLQQAPGSLHVAARFTARQTSCQHTPHIRQILYICVQKGRYLSALNIMLPLAVSGEGCIARLWRVHSLLGLRLRDCAHHVKDQQTNNIRCAEPLLLLWDTDDIPGETQ